MMYEIGKHPGAVWRKCDLQVHTPRDPQWSGSANLAGGTPELEAARDAWADGFVAQCLSNGIGAIAITDHHDLCFIEYVARAIERVPNGGDALWLFPGMEVTCRDAVQCLVIFDRGCPDATLRRLFGHLPNIPDPERNAATNPQASQSGKDVEAFLAGVQDDGEMQPRSIVLPHASNDGAHKSMLRQGFAPRFSTVPFDGIYTDKAFERLDDSAKRKIYGEVKEWGARRRGIIPTGDNRSANFQRLGAHECWIRLGEPTAEAIRQAVLADEARITYSRPALPSHRILELRVSSSLTGADFAVTFNDGFTALIGGRGAGKSGLLPVWWTPR